MQSTRTGNALVGANCRTINMLQTSTRLLVRITVLYIKLMICYTTVQEVVDFHVHRAGKGKFHYFQTIRLTGPTSPISSRVIMSRYVNMTPSVSPINRQYLGGRVFFAISFANHIWPNSVSLIN